MPRWEMTRCPVFSDRVVATASHRPIRGCAPLDPVITGRGLPSTRARNGLLSGLQAALPLRQWSAAGEDSNGISTGVDNAVLPGCQFQSRANPFARTRRANMMPCRRHYCCCSLPDFLLRLHSDRAQVQVDLSQSGAHHPGESNTRRDSRKIDSRPPCDSPLQLLALSDQVLLYFRYLYQSAFTYCVPSFSSKRTVRWWSPFQRPSPHCGRTP